MPIFYYIEEGRKDFIMKKRKRILTALAVSIAMLGQTFLVSAEDLNTQTVQTETVSETAKGSNSESTVKVKKVWHRMNLPEQKRRIITDRQKKNLQHPKKTKVNQDSRKYSSHIMYR